MAPKKPIRVLIIEDSEFDARILVNTLRQSGYDPTFRQVDTAAAMREALTTQTWDVILSDYNMPEFSAPAALKRNSCRRRIEISSGKSFFSATWGERLCRGCDSRQAQIAAWR